MSDAFRHLSDVYLRKAKRDMDKSHFRNSSVADSIDEREEYMYEDPALKSIDTTFKNADKNFRPKIEAVNDFTNDFMSRTAKCRW